MVYDTNDTLNVYIFYRRIVKNVWEITDLLKINYNVFSNDITQIIAMYCAHETPQTLDKK